MTPTSMAKKCSVFQVYGEILEPCRGTLWLLTMDDFASRAHLAMSAVFLLSQLEEECVRRLVGREEGRDQGCCSASYSVQDSPHHKGLSKPRCQ